MKFSECTIANLEQTFGLRQVDNLEGLNDWLADDNDISELSRQMLLLFRQELKKNFFNWNEQELSLHFIGPIFSVADFTGENYNAYANRPVFGVVEGIELNGNPDGMIAKGRREPEIPYFCFQEYKKELDPNGHPAPQALAAMLVGQMLNQYKNPMYGCYVIGKTWNFIVLENKNYVISESYDATTDELFKIFNLLLNLKKIVSNLASN
ncbi:MAG: hypothetical protein RLZZ306_3333 [Bacteroidota bacterium]|jgi:hypothetical protein